MNSIHNNGEDDKSLDEGMDKLDQAYTQLPDEHPQELLDQAILNSAHRAVEKKPHWMQFGWLHGLTTAAVVVLAISLMFNQREQLPSFENELKVDESVRLRRATVGKKQSPEMQAGEPVMELKEKREDRREIYQPAPAAAAPQAELMESSEVELPAETTADAFSTVNARKIERAKKDSNDEDLSGNRPADEEQLLDNATLASDAPELEAITKQIQPAATATGLREEMDDLTDKDARIEQQLQEIILLKQSGDEAWKSELKSFIENYPDYPLPTELSD